MLGGGDVKFSLGSTSHEYVVNAMNSSGNIVHGVEKKNTPMNASTGTPTQAGGLWDVRDTEGLKAIAHLDWSHGEGQISLDTEDASPSRYHSSKGFDVHSKGMLQSARASNTSGRSNLCGPIFSALGYLWKGHRAIGASSMLSYSSSVESGDSYATINTVPSGIISGFTTDGRRVYFCVPSGSESGVWRNNVDSGGSYTADVGTFRKLTAAGSGIAAYKIAYQSGIIFCATPTSAGLLKVSDKTYEAVTPVFINDAVTTVELLAAGNAVYWVVSSGSYSFVYEIAYDPDLQTATTKQLTEMTGGFIATCATSYLGKLYVGGYFESETDGVGKGAVYVVDTEAGTATPLFEVGDYPEDTVNPQSADNDNRVFSITASHKDLYVATNTNVYRWDVDDGGYSHVFDHPGNYIAALKTSFNEGSTISWDGTNLYVDGVHTSPFPSGWYIDGDYSPTVAEHWTGKWSTAGGIATFSGSSPQLWQATPAGGEDLSNSAGTTIQVTFGDDRSGSFSLQISDGTRQAKFRVINNTVYMDRYWYPEVYGTYTDWMQLYDPEPGDPTNGYGWYTWTGWKQMESGAKYWTNASLPGPTYRCSNYFGTTLSATTSSQVLNFKLRGTTASITDAAGNVILSTDYTAALATDRIDITFEKPMKIDSILLNSSGYVASSYSISSSYFPSTAKHKGSVVSLYSDVEQAKQYSFNAVTDGSPVKLRTSATTDGTTVNHGLYTGKMVYVRTTGTTPAIDGWYSATLDGTNPSTTFTIPVNVTSHTTHAGTVDFPYDEGLVYQDTGYANTSWLKTSYSTFHSGSILKKFHKIEVLHDVLPPLYALGVSYTIDGNSSASTGVTDGTRTYFNVDTVGYGIDATVSLLYAWGDSVPAVKAVIRGVNVLWDFVKTPIHVYDLDLRPSSRWKEDPEAAAAFLFLCADKIVTIEDRYSGEYTGIVDKIDYLQAPRSLSEPTSGTARITVREIQ